jgi:hypothetical protein
MQGKEGKQYKANSLYQFLRRLGFFPTEVNQSSNAVASTVASRAVMQEKGSNTRPTHGTSSCSLPPSSLFFFFFFPPVPPSSTATINDVIDQKKKHCHSTQL